MNVLCRLGIHKRRKKTNYMTSVWEKTVIVSCDRCHFILHTRNYVWSQQAGELQ